MPNLEWRDAIIKVLEISEEPMHYTAIADAIAEKGLRADFGATPAISVSTAINISLRNDGDSSPFIRVGRGYYALRGSAVYSEEGSDEASVAEITEETGLINAFGMYWWRDKILWTNTPRLLGQQQPGSTPVDFAGQKGVYLLYDARDVVYVGRVTDQSLALRLKQHTIDRLNGRWDRFSWFGVFPVSQDGSLSTDTPNESFTLETLIVTMEALLIEGLEPPQNRKRGDDFRAIEFLQVEDPEIQKSQIVQLMDELKKKL